MARKSRRRRQVRVLYIAIVAGQVVEMQRGGLSIIQPANLKRTLLESANATFPALIGFIDYNFCNNQFLKGHPRH